jgi:flagellar basal body-associated protein FliL
MKFTFGKKKKKLNMKKADRLNPHRYWIILLCGFILVLTAELIYFSWFFLHTTKTLDAPAIPRLETNISKIKSMEKKLNAAETAIQKRTGTEETTASQNTDAVVE